MYTKQKLTRSWQALLFFLSLLIVGFGQPVWNLWLGVAASTIGYALFWRILLDYSAPKKRFLIAGAWFTGVQLIQLSWAIYHPYYYIYFVYLFFSIAVGLQFGALGLLITPRLLQSWVSLVGISSLWTIFEWSRLYFLSGYSWNPAGLALTSNIYALQTASLWGVFGLSFWVLLVNLLGLRLWLFSPNVTAVSAYVVILAAPSIYGFTHIRVHEQSFSEAPTFRALLVQPAFAAEEALEFKDFKEYAAYVVEEWRHILTLMKKYKGVSVDLIALPEYVVPFGTYTFIYPAHLVESFFRESFGSMAAKSFPQKIEPLARRIDPASGSAWKVNNAFWLQTLANMFEAPVIAGLEDAEDVDSVRERYSAAIYFTPFSKSETFNASRYAKRILVPMAEYIPFTFCAKLAASYGIQGSFTCGRTPMIATAGKTPFGVSICYEETFGYLMRESRQQGAELFVNLTSDVWFPNSLLPYQHFEHAKLRSVENGVPLLRACNTGITSAVDSFGRTVAILENEKSEHEWVSDCLLAEVPLYSYLTLYTDYGDMPMIGFCVFNVLAWAGFSLLKNNTIFYS